MDLTMDDYHMDVNSCWGDRARQLYFEWLCGLVRVDIYGRYGYWFLMTELHTIPFVWIIPNDDNRIEDGLLLRQRFCAEYDIYDNDYWEDPCSVLEMLVALTLRMNDAISKPEEDDQIDSTFLQLLQNLNISYYTDDNYQDNNHNPSRNRYKLQRDMDKVNQIIDDLINRRYRKDGFGGLFPLVRTDFDQRKLEIWNQMNEYLIENYFRDSVR